MVYWSICCNQSCLHGIGHRARDVNISAWSTSGCFAPVLPRHVCMVKASRCFRRHVCMVYRNTCFSQICLHGLRKLMLRPDISAWSKGSFALPDMFARSTGAYTLCSETCLHIIQEHVLIRYMSAWSSGAYAAPRHNEHMLPETCLHDLQDLVLLPAKSAWSTGFCDASRHVWWSTGSYAATL
jgi:hypothetical protein